MAKKSAERVRQDLDELQRYVKAGHDALEANNLGAALTYFQAAKQCISHAIAVVRVAMLDDPGTLAPEE